MDEFPVKGCLASSRILPANEGENRYALGTAVRGFIRRVRYLPLGIGEIHAVNAINVSPRSDHFAGGEWGKLDLKNLARKAPKKMENI